MGYHGNIPNPLVLFSIVCCCVLLISQQFVKYLLKSEASYVVTLTVLERPWKNLVTVVVVVVVAL